jgi:hypothetical protein
MHKTAGDCRRRRNTARRAGERDRRGLRVKLAKPGGPETIRRALASRRGYIVVLRMIGACMYLGLGGAACA